MDDKHIMVSLGDEKAKAVAEVIGNKTCNKILDFLAENEATVSDISEKLKMPLNTVDYNIKKLIKAGLIEKASHWWSVKGKKMPTYRVSNRQIIISPKRSLVKAFAWVVGLTGLTSLTIRQFMGNSYSAGEQIMDSARNVAIEEASGGGALMATATEKVAGDAAPVVLNAASNSGGFVSFIASLSPWSWFLIGAWFAVFLFFAITLINKGRLDR
jgi:DNA-binding transcriptional ArsR family regulator